MELDEISELIKQDGGKFIIVENGKPTLAIMSFDEYKGKIKKATLNPSSVSESISEEEIPAESSPALNEEVNIEDLPLE